LGSTGDRSTGEQEEDTLWLGRIEDLYRRTQRLIKQGLHQRAMENATRMRDLARLHLGEKRPLVAASMNHLGALHHIMGDDLSALPLLQQALEILRSSLGEEHELVAQGAGALTELGADLALRFEQTGQLADIDAAIAAVRSAAHGVPRSHCKRPEYLSLLGAFLQSRYQQTLQPADLDESIAAFQLAVDALPGDSLDRPRYLCQLGKLLAGRYEMTGRPVDLDNAVVALRAAVDDTPVGSPARPAYLGHFGGVLWRRHQTAGRSVDLDAAIVALRAGVDCIPAGSPERAHYNNTLGLSLVDRYLRTGRVADLDAAIVSHQEAVDSTPPDSSARPRFLSNLGACLLTVYQRTGRLNNLDSAMTALRASVDADPADRFSRPYCLMNLGVGLYERYARLGRLDDLDAVVSSYRAALDGSLPDSPDRPQFLSLLGNGLGELYERTGLPADLDAAIVALQEAVDLVPTGHTYRPTYVNNLGKVLSDRYERTGLLADLDAATAAYREAVDVKPTDSPDRRRYVSNLGANLATRYERTKQLADLDAAIAAYREAVAGAPTDSPDRLRYLLNLGGGLRRRYERTRTLSDLEDGIAAYEEGCQLGLVLAPAEALNGARAWGGWATIRHRWSEAARAWDAGIQAIEQLYESQLLPGSKETWLREAQGLGAHAAYARARTGEPAKAVVALERSRARLLSEALIRDRTDLVRVQLLDAQAHADYEHAVGQLRQLEVRERADRMARSGTSVQSSAEMVPREVRQVRADLDAAVRRIQQIPGFSTFLKVPDWGMLAEAVMPGRPLVYLVTTRTGSVALLVHRPADGPAEDATGIVAETVWADGLTTTDLHGLLVHRDDLGNVVGGYLPGQLDEAWLETALTALLPRLGAELIEPVAARLRALKVASIVLVPTGLLGLLPLHAATYQVKRRQVCLLDEVDVAYAPSARVLGAARSGLAARGAQPAVLVGVGNPLPHPTPLSFARAELAEVASFFPMGASHPLYEAAATKATLLGLLPGATYVHLACHGSFEADAPLNSRLELAPPSGAATGDEQGNLRLGELLGQAWFESSRLVVLSACQTAITDYQQLPDEAIGLPAGLLQAGVPGVVGTLWAVNDLSMTLVMTKFYELHRRGDGTTGPMAPMQALRQAQLWLRKVTAGELAAYFEERRQLAEASQGMTETGMRLEEASLGVLQFGLETPEFRPFAERPYCWAPLVYIGE
jgi:CHAT domain-containing protein/tetratricopeptide (TPR) repeat protein